MRWTALFLAFAACAAAPTVPDVQDDAADRLRAQLSTADDIKRGMLLDELAKVELRRAQEANTVFAYRRFLAEFPHGEEATTARALLEGLCFDAAALAGTRDGWSAFLEEFPRGHRTPEARGRLGSLTIAQALKSSDLELVRRTLGRYPEHPERPLLQAREDELAWAKGGAGSREDVGRYLGEHPSGAFRVEALARREALERQDLLESEDLPRARARASEADATLEMKALVAELELRLALRSLDVEALAALAGPGDPAAAPVAERARARLDSLAKAPLSGEVQAAVAAARAGAGLPSRESLIAAIAVADPLERVEALRELAEWADRRDLDALLETVDSRYLDVRLEAVESLRTYAGALPPPVWRSFVAARELEALTRALSAGPWRRVAALRDADGRGREALAAWQEVLKADPDDLVARARTLALQQQIGDRLAVSSAARELSKGALSFADGRWLQPPDAAAPREERRDGPGRVVGLRADVTVLRQLCAAIELGDRASRALAALRAAAGPGEQELLGLALVDGDRTLSRLRSKKTELEGQSKRQDATFVPCGTDRSTAVLAASRVSRVAALRRLGELADPRTGEFVAALAFSPAAEVRAAAGEAHGRIAAAPEPAPLQVDGDASRKAPPRKAAKGR